MTSTHKTPLPPDWWYTRELPDAARGDLTARFAKSQQRLGMHEGKPIFPVWAVDLYAVQQDAAPESVSWKMHDNRRFGAPTPNPALASMLARLDWSRTWRAMLTNPQLQHAVHAIVSLGLSDTHTTNAIAAWLADMGAKAKWLHEV